MLFLPVEATMAGYLKTTHHSVGKIIELLSSCDVGIVADKGGDNRKRSQTLERNATPAAAAGDPPVEHWPW